MIVLPLSRGGGLPPVTHTEHVEIGPDVMVRLTYRRGSLWPWSWEVFRLTPAKGARYWARPSPPDDDHPDGMAWTRGGALRQARRAT